MLPAQGPETLRPLLKPHSYRPTALPETAGLGVSDKGSLGGTLGDTRRVDGAVRWDQAIPATKPMKIHTVQDKWTSTPQVLRVRLCRKPRGKPPAFASLQVSGTPRTRQTWAGCPLLPPHRAQDSLCLKTPMTSLTHYARRSNLREKLAAQQVLFKRTQYCIN